MAPRLMKLVRGASAVAVSCLMATSSLSAQDRTTLSGFVVDKSTGRGISGAQIFVVAEKRTVVTDSSGKYRIQDLPVGPLQLMVRALGFPPLQLHLDLAAAARSDRSIQLDSTAAGRGDSAQALPAVSVTAAPTPVNYRLVDFERRRQTGSGQYLTEDEITKSGAYTVADAVKNMRGVLYECGGGTGCHIHMARAPMRCLPEYIVDDRVMNDFGPYTPIRDVIGVEVYSGPTEVPGEYAGRYAGCGVIVIWTRSGPTRKQEKKQDKN